MKLSGVFAPVPTPIDDTDRVDLSRLRAAFGRWLASPLTGFVVLGSNGEAVLLDEEESDRVVATARELVPRGRPFIVGAGRESTRATIGAAKRAAELGADVVIVRTPGFFKTQMTTEVFIRHYTAVADASPIPILLYNFTAVTGVNLPLAAVSALATHPNIVGMKESGGDIAQIGELVSGTPSGFAVLAGSSTTFYAALCAGAVGGILALGCVVPDACARLYELTVQQRHGEARLLQEQLAPLGRLVGSVHGVAGLKAALRLTGCDVGVPRLPLLPVTGVGVEALRSALDKVREVVA
jgi:4-hydroxy-2-oxoglutarate aldolase